MRATGVVPFCAAHGRATGCGVRAKISQSTVGGARMSKEGGAATNNDDEHGLGKETAAMARAVSRSQAQNHAGRVVATRQGINLIGQRRQAGLA